ncbi:MAG: tyrosine-protein kinase [Solirubrobacteraceae bacterium]|jgi:capsular exopolysaccharide synthesis family protein|nr:tyrosine-protein kinase [Solirubrobacteraceae bacterium]
MSASSAGTRFPEGREEQPLRRYLDVVKARWWFVAAVVVLCTGAAALYAVTATKIYDARADILVTPVPDDQTAVLGLGLLRKASDPTRDVTTATQLIDNAQVAARVQRDLGSSSSPEALLQKISVSPVANSSVVAVTASSPDPHAAQRLANAFGQGAVDERTAQLHQELGPAIRTMRARIRQITGKNDPSTATAATQPLFQQLAAMEALQSAPDPTIRLETPAALPTAPASPRKRLAIVGGLIAGLLIGIGGVFALNALDPRRGREDGVTALGLSVLTRVPRLGRSGGARHAFDESFRFLRTMLRFAAPDEPISTLAVTSFSEQEGKTTTSFQLAMATLEAGQTVLLVEADPYRPGLHAMVEPHANGGANGDAAPGLLEYLSGFASLDDILVPTTVPGLSFVPAGALRTNSITGLLEQERGRSFVRDLEGLADLVILDCPPVGPRSDAVLIASSADAVILIVDVRQTADSDVAETVRRLRRTDSNLVGVVLNRDESASAGYEYQQFGGPTAARNALARVASFRR